MFDNNVALQVPALAIALVAIVLILRGSSKSAATEMAENRKERQATYALIKQLGDACHQHSTDREERLAEALLTAAASAKCSNCQNYKPDPRVGYQNTGPDPADVVVGDTLLTIPPGHGVIDDGHGPRVATPAQFEAFAADRAAQARRHNKQHHKGS